MEHLTGTIEHVLQHSPETGAFVVRIIDRERKQARVAGYAPRVIAGEALTAEGSWVGRADQRQFEASKTTVAPPRSVEGIRRYLSSGAIKGIGAAYADKLIAAFGDDVFEVIDKAPARLRDVAGIGEERASAIVEAWHEQRAIREIMVFLHANGVTTAKAARIYRAYGTDAVKVVLANPYQLASDIDGIGFISADQIAKNVGFNLCSPERLRAGVIYAMNDAAANGHTAVKKSALAQAAMKLLEAPLTAVDDTIHEEVFNETLIAAEKGGETHVALPPLFYAEKGVAGRLLRLAAEPFPRTVTAASASLDQALTKIARPLDLEEESAVRFVLGNKVGIITAGAGSRKLQVLQAIVQMLSLLGVNTLVTSPVADAAERVSVATGLDVLAISRLTETPEGDAEPADSEAQGVDAVVVFEASVMDTAQTNALLKKIPAGAVLVLMGDPELFPSVGPGQIFRDITNSGRFPILRLQLSGHEQPAGIVENAQKIARGEYPEAPGIATKAAFRFVFATDPKSAAQRILDLVTLELPGHLGVNPLRDIQVLCPMSKGECGTKALNAALAQKLNRNEPRGAEINGKAYRVNDKVTVTAKRRGRLVSVGDIGSIVAMDLEARRLQVEFYGRTEPYDFDQVGLLAHAYATPLQRAAGREFPVVIIPVVTQHFMMLRRSLLYTGVVSGKTLVILVGQPKALAIAVKNADDDNRTTLLPEMLSSGS